MHLAVAAGDVGRVDTRLRQAGEGSAGGLPGCRKIARERQAGRGRRGEPESVDAVSGAGALG